MKTKKKIDPNVIYKLDGRAPLGVAIPLGLQHVLAMFVGNLAPIFVLTGALSTPEMPFPPELRITMIQCAMLVSGLVTLIQLYPLKMGYIKIGANLPIVMGTSFAFVPTMQNLGMQLIAEGKGPADAMGYIIGGVIAGSVVEILIGLFFKPLKKFFPPLVIGSVLITVGIKLLTTGATYFVGGSAAPDIGAGQYWIVASTVFLIVVLLNRFAKGMWKITSILLGVFVGYVLAACLGMVNFSHVTNATWFDVPLPLNAQLFPQFRLDIILAFAAVYVVSGLETMGNTGGITMAAFGREATAEETGGAILADGVGSAFAGFFNTPPNTAFGQNAGIVAMTKVVNKFCIMTGAGVLVLAALFPKIGAIFNAMPNCVMGGAVLSVFAMIMLNGIKMIAKGGLTDRNSLILAITFGLGYGVGGLDASIKARFPEFLRVIFSEPVAAVCIVSVLACIIFKADKPEDAHLAIQAEKSGEIQ